MKPKPAPPSTPNAGNGANDSAGSSNGGSGNLLKNNVAEVNGTVKSIDKTVVCEPQDKAVNYNEAVAYAVTKGGKILTRLQMKTFINEKRNLHQFNDDQWIATSDPKDWV